MKGNCKIHIHCSDHYSAKSGPYILANFPLQTLATTWASSNATLFGEDAVQVSLCQKLTINVESPSPRVAVKSYTARKTVDKIIGWLNSSSNLQFSRIDTALVFDVENIGAQLVWNDFAMLLGPLSKLQPSFALARVDRPAGQLFDARIDRHCSHLEKLLKGGSPDAKRLVEYQQAILDVRLPISFIGSGLGLTPTYEVENPYDLLQLPDECCDNVNAGIKRLRTWCSTYNVAPPPRWLHDLGNVIKDSKILKGAAEEVFEKVLGIGPYPSKFVHWMAGLATGFNPFQCPETDNGHGQSLT